MPQYCKLFSPKVFCFIALVVVMVIKYLALIGPIGNKISLFNTATIATRLPELLSKRKSTSTMDGHATVSYVTIKNDESAQKLAR